jgi:hypothetical protein
VHAQLPRESRHVDPPGNYLLFKDTRKSGVDKNHHRHAESQHAPYSHQTTSNSARQV